MSRLRLLPLLVVVLFLLIAPSASAATPDGFYGINGQVLNSSSPDTWEAHLRGMAATGAQQVRTDANWSRVERVAPVNGIHTYDWTATDQLASALARHGLRWYPTMAYGTTWAASEPGPKAWMSLPRDPAAYAAYVGAFAARYGAAGSFWRQHPELPRLPVGSYEIWNEPNTERFIPHQATAAERYSDLVVAASTALHRADPSARAVIGGLSAVGADGFLRRMAARHSDLWSKVQAVGFHPYGGSPQQAFSRIASVRATLRAVGVGSMPIEITETGWASPPASEARRSASMRTLATELPRSDCGVTRFIPYTWNTKETAGTNPEDWFGIARSDGTLKPTGSAFRTAVRQMRGLEGGAPGGGVIRCTPQKPVKAAPALRVVLRSTSLRRRSRALRASVACTSGCTVSLRLTVKRHGRARRVTTRRVRLSAGHGKAVRMRVSRRRLKALRRGRIEVRAEAVGDGGRRANAVRRVRLRR